MRRIKSGSPMHLALCERVCEKAHEETLLDAQGIVQVGSDEWDELYEEQWHTAHDEVFADVELIPE